MKSLVLFQRLLAYARPYWVMFIVAILTMTIAAAAEASFPALIKLLMDDGLTERGDIPVVAVPIAVLSIFLLRGAASFAGTYVMYWLSQQVLLNIRRDVFGKLLALPSSFYDTRSAGDLISRVINDAQQVLAAATNVVIALVRESLLLVGLFCWLIWINWKLTIIVAVLMPPLLYLTRKFSSRMRRVGRNYFESIGKMTSIVEEAIAGNRVVKLFTAQDYEKEKFKGINTENRAQGMKLSIASALQGPMTQLIASVGVATVLTIALIQTRQGEATIGDFVSFVTAMVMMLNPLRHLADINSQLQRGLSAAEGLFSLLDEVEERDHGTKTLKTCRGTVVFRDVVFRHRNRDRETISGFSLEVPRGATFALVGPSGGGKTSILHLLPRLYEIDSGSIEIDGVDISELELDFLRNQISLVSQDVILFNDTIASNIAYGRPDQSLERIQEAANSADLGDFVTSLEHGFQTIIGDNGVQLSGGQRQRIAVARAILKDAPILLLDEATASLDRHSERKVQNSISQLRKKRTTIIVAHRLSTVIDADQIIVVDHGRIAQRGTHLELLAQPGIYRMLYNTLRNDEE